MALISRFASVTSVRKFASVSTLLFGFMAALFLLGPSSATSNNDWMVLATAGDVDWRGPGVTIGGWEDLEANGRVPDGAEILDAGLVPIIEPEVTISIADKAEAESILRDEIAKHLDTLPAGREVMLKLTLPETANHYKPLIDHDRVLRVVALSGGYSRDEANTRLAQNTGMIASFSRALTEGLSDQQSDDAFDGQLKQSIGSIYKASVAG